MLKTEKKSNSELENGTGVKVAEKVVKKLAQKAVKKVASEKPVKKLAQKAVKKVASEMQKVVLRKNQQVRYETKIYVYPNTLTVDKKTAYKWAKDGVVLFVNDSGGILPSIQERNPILDKIGKDGACDEVFGPINTNLSEKGSSVGSIDEEFGDGFKEI